MKRNIAEIFQQIETPEILERQRLSEMLAQAMLGLLAQESEALVQLSEFLTSSQIDTLVSEGKLTLGMIRPNADHNKAGLPDLLAEKHIRESINPPLEIANVFSVIFDEIAVNDFYQGQPKQRQLDSPPYFGNSGFSNRWEEFLSLMTSGPTTVMLLHSDDGLAVPNWRNQVGHWNIEKTIQPQTIRGKFGLDNFNNLVHGSDSADAVKNELRIIAEQLERMILER